MLYVKDKSLSESGISYNEKSCFAYTKIVLKIQNVYLKIPKCVFKISFGLAPFKASMEDNTIVAYQLTFVS